MIKGKNILITGSSGFVGQALVHTLINENTVIGIDIVKPNFSKNIGSFRTIEDLAGNIGNYELPFFDFVFHLGEYSRIENSFKNYSHILNQNLLSTPKFFNWAVNNSDKIIYAASSTRMGLDTEPTNASPYAFSKSYSAQLLQNLGNWFGVNYAISYFYNVYGEGEVGAGDLATVIEIFRLKMIKGEPLPVVLPGNQSRNFTHISDTVKALVSIAEFGNGDGYGIGSPQRFTIKEVANMFGGEIKLCPERRGNRSGAKLETTKLLELGWECEMSLPDYISRLRQNKWEH